MRPLVLASSSRFWLFPARRGGGTASLEARTITIATADDAKMFTVEIADTDALRARGLMFRQRLPEDGGCCSISARRAKRRCGMKNTYIPLDMLFIRADGTIAYIAENTVPRSEAIIGVREPVLAVLELAEGPRANWGSGRVTRSTIAFSRPRTDNASLAPDRAFRI